jgi:hypothetical protein
MDGAAFNMSAGTFVPKGKTIFQKDDIGPSILDLEDEGPKKSKAGRKGKKKGKVMVAAVTEEKPEEEDNNVHPFFGKDSAFFNMESKPLEEGKQPDPANPLNFDLN